MSRIIECRHILVPFSEIENEKCALFRKISSKIEPYVRYVVDFDIKIKDDPFEGTVYEVFIDCQRLDEMGEGDIYSLWKWVRNEGYNQMYDKKMRLLQSRRISGIKP